jgi:hypothetical protein
LPRLDFFIDRVRQRQHDRIEATLERAREIVHAFVAIVRGRDDIEPLASLRLVAELGDGQRLLREDGNERVLHIGGNARQLLHARNPPFAHPAHDRAGHERVERRPLGEELRVVPTVAHRLLGRARGALHEKRRVAADRCGEMLRDPRLGSARHAEQEERAIRGKRGDCDLDHAPLADVFRRNLHAARIATHQVGRDGPRRELPVWRLRLVIVTGEAVDMAGIRVESKR